MPLLSIMQAWRKKLPTRLSPKKNRTNYIQQTELSLYSGPVLPGLTISRSMHNGLITFDTVLVPLKSPDGTVTSVLGISRDIAELKRKEETLVRANHQLNLLSDVKRHDILTKITVIMGYLALYRKKSSDPGIQELINKMEPPTTMIHALIEETRIYQNLGTHEPQWHDLDRMIAGLHAPATIRVVAHVQTIFLRADPILAKVYANLLDNSIRHGERVTEISVSYEEMNGELNIIWVDNGVGVPVSKKKKKSLNEGLENTRVLGCSLYVKSCRLPISGSWRMELKEKEPDLQYPSHLVHGNTVLKNLLLIFGTYPSSP